MGGSALFTLLTDILVRATPLILTGLSVSLAFRCGILNIGAEGQLLVGAATSIAITLVLESTLGWSVVPLALIGGFFAGAVWASIAAELRSRFQVLEAISTIMLNFIAVYLVSFLVRGPFQEPTHIYPQTSSIAVYSHLPILLPGTRLHAGFAIAVVAALILWWVMRNTAAGFRVRVMGANPNAATVSAMLSSTRITTKVFLVSGGLAGFAGAIEVHGVTFALYENLSPGYGYTAIAVALLAGLNPAAVIASGVFLGALETGASALQRDVGIPSTLVSTIEAFIILVVLASKHTRKKSAQRENSITVTPSPVSA